MNIAEAEQKRDPTSDFQLVEKLGEGSYGSVWKSVHIKTGTVTAIKRVPVENDLDEILNEIKIMKQCRSPYIISYYGSYFKDNELWIVMEFCGGGSVSDLMRILDKTLTEDQIAVVVRDALKGLNYLHGKNIVHRDIKPQNILIGHDLLWLLKDFDNNNNNQCNNYSNINEYQIWLSDFGESSQLTNIKTTFFSLVHHNTDKPVGTQHYMAPEVKNIGINHHTSISRNNEEEEEEKEEEEGLLVSNNNKIDWYKADIYSLGIVINHIMNEEIRMNDIELNNYIISLHSITNTIQKLKFELKFENINQTIIDQIEKDMNISVNTEFLNCNIAQRSKNVTNMINKIMSLIDLIKQNCYNNKSEKDNNNDDSDSNSGSNIPSTIKLRSSQTQPQIPSPKVPNNPPKIKDSSNNSPTNKKNLIHAKMI